VHEHHDQRLIAELQQRVTQLEGELAARKQQDDQPE
jgi:hypothetical protein